MLYIHPAQLVFEVLADGGIEENVAHEVPGIRNDFSEFGIVLEIGAHYAGGIDVGADDGVVQMGLSVLVIVFPEIIVRKQVEVFVSRDVIVLQGRGLCLEASGEIGHTEQAARDRAGLAMDPRAFLGLEYLREAAVHAGCYGGVLAASAYGELAVHPVVFGIYPEHVCSKLFPLFREQAGFFGFFDGLIRSCAAAAYLVA